MPSEDDLPNQLEHGPEPGPGPRPGPEPERESESESERPSGHRGFRDTAWWLRARGRAAPLGTLAFAALVLVTAFTAALLPRAMDASADDALASALDRARPGDRLLSATTVVDSGVGEPAELRDLVGPDSVRNAERALRGSVKAPLRVDRTDAAYAEGVAAHVAGSLDVASLLREREAQRQEVQRGEAQPREAQL